MADGTIEIDTRIDASGMNKGTKSITKNFGGVMTSVKRIAAALVAAFAGASLLAAMTSVFGKFNLYASSMGKQIWELNYAFGNLQGAVLNLALTALSALMPYLISAINWFTALLGKITLVVGALFGLKKTIGDVARKGGLAAFDKLNVLQTSGPATSPAAQIIPPELLARLAEFKQGLIDLFTPLWDALVRVSQNPIWATIGAGLLWLWNNVLLPLGTWIIAVLAPVLVDLFGAGLDVVNEAMIALAPSAQKFFDEFLKPLAVWTGGKIIAFLDWLTLKLRELAEWIKANPEKFLLFMKILGILLIVFLTLGTAISIVTFILSLLALVFNTTIIIVGLVLIVIGLLILALIWLYKNWDLVKQKALEVWANIQTTWAGAGQWFKDHVGIPMVEAVGSSLNSIYNNFANTFNRIQDFVSNIINGIVDNFNWMSTILSGFNFGGANNQQPVYTYYPPTGWTTGSGSAGSGAGTLAPHMATGGVIPPNAEFLATLGDQSSGKNIESPVSLMRETFEEVLANALANQTITINFSGTTAELVRLLKPELDRENTRVGKSLIKGLT